MYWKTRKGSGLVACAPVTGQGRRSNCRRAQCAASTRPARGLCAPRSGSLTHWPPDRGTAAQALAWTLACKCLRRRALPLHSWRSWRRCVRRPRRGGTRTHWQLGRRRSWRRCRRHVGERPSRASQARRQQWYYLTTQAQRPLSRMLLRHSSSSTMHDPHRWCTTSATPPSACACSQRPCRRCWSWQAAALLAPPSSLSVPAALAAAARQAPATLAPCLAQASGWARAMETQARRFVSHMLPGRHGCAAAPSMRLLAYRHVFLALAVERRWCSATGCMTAALWRRLDLSGAGSRYRWRPGSRWRRLALLLAHLRCRPTLLPL